MPELTVQQVILQSQIIHPDWTADAHLDFLFFEAYDLHLPRTGKRDFVARLLRDNIEAGRAPATPEGAKPKYDPDCDWAGHADAMQEVGWCSVCQH